MNGSSFIPRSATLVRAAAGVALALGAFAPALAASSCPVRPTLMQQRLLAHAGSVDELRQYAFITRGIWGLDTYRAADEIEALNKAQAACRNAVAEPAQPATPAPGAAVALADR